MYLPLFFAPQMAILSVPKSGTLRINHGPGTIHDFQDFAVVGGCNGGEGDELLDVC